MSRERLPVVGSTAKTTAFCSEMLEVGSSSLWLDGNGKITAGNGTLAEPSPNAFSLLDQATAVRLPGDREHEHCPGSTPTCRASCYVQNLRAAQPDLHALYRHNSAEIRSVLADSDLADAWALHLAQWVTVNAAGGFRWHVSGDVFSLEYARWIADVCRESPTVDHWIYTRSFAYLAPLAEVATVRGGNLAINLSADRDNLSNACAAALDYGGPSRPLRVCYLVTEPDEAIPPLDADDVIFPDYKLRPRQHATLADSEWWQSITPFQRGLVCPVDAHGKAESRRCGPCSRCLT